MFVDILSTYSSSPSSSGSADRTLVKNSRCHRSEPEASAVFDRQSGGVVSHCELTAMWSWETICVFHLMFLHHDTIEKAVTGYYAVGDRCL